MNDAVMPVLDALLAAVLAAAGGYVGREFSRVKGRHWVAGFVAPFAVIMMVTVARRFSWLSYEPAFSWLMRGRREFFILGAAVAMMFMTLVPRLTSKRSKVLVTALMAVAVLNLSVAPFALPVAVRTYLLGLDTQVDAEGVCLQNTGYTCGPAAAVTALRALGVAAGEGQVAVAAQTTPIWGTELDILGAACEELYGGDGVTCELTAYRDAGELAGRAAVVPIKHAFLVDHYVCVLDVGEDGVTVGDPLQGKRMYSRGEFEELWRHAALVFKRSGEGDTR